MHSTVFCFSNFPLDVDESLPDVSSDSFNEKVLNALPKDADYVCCKNEWIPDVMGKRLSELFGSCFHTVDDTCFTLSGGFEKPYFRKRFEEFQKWFKATDFEKFSRNTMYPCHLKSLIDDDYGYYVCVPGFDNDAGGFMVCTMDEWVRSVAESSTENEALNLRLFGVLDYHC